MNNGIEIEGHMIRDNAIACCGDTPGANEIAGFKEGVGFAESKCRMCDCKNPRMQTEFRHEQFNLRSKESHNQQCEEIETAQNPTVKKELSKRYGVNRRSSISDFPYFTRFEAKHQIHKHKLNKGRNYKNIVHSCTERNQMHETLDQSKRPHSFIAKKNNNRSNKEDSTY